MIFEHSVGVPISDDHATVDTRLIEKTTMVDILARGGTNSTPVGRRKWQPVTRQVLGFSRSDYMLVMFT